MNIGVEEAIRLLIENAWNIFSLLGNESLPSGISIALSMLAGFSLLTVMLEKITNRI